MKTISTFAFLLLPLFAVLAKTTRPPKHKLPIVGGTVVSASVIPSQILISGGNNGGGTVVAKSWILTAAHIATSGSSLQFYAGVVSKSNLASGQNRVYKQHKYHPSYNGVPTSPLHDVALIQVTQDFSFSGGNVQPIQLASDDNSGLWAIGQSPDVSGFGQTGPSDPLSNDLRRTNVTVTAKDDTYKHITAGGNGTPTQHDACFGDSGGPLIANNKQVGIVSAGALNCQTGGRYMMVARYLDWITETIHTLGTPDFVCNNTTFENLSVLPDGVTFQWSASPSNLFTNTSGSGLSFTTANNGTNSGKGTVTLTVITPLGTYTHNKEVWVGKPHAIDIATDGTFSISGNSTTICKSLGYCMTVSSGELLNGSLTPMPTATNFTYSGWPTSSSFFTQSTLVTPNDRVCFGTNNTGSYFLIITASNACGTNNRNIIVQVNNCGFRVFPNPAQSIVAVDFEEPDRLESIPDEILLIEEKSKAVVKSKDLKSLKNSKQDKNYSKVEFDVAALPRGIYYLHLKYDEKSQNRVEQVRVLLNN